MKKSTKIQLVIITAAFASCNNHIIPSMASANINLDSTMTALPLYNENVDCNCWQPDSSIWNHSVNPLRINYFSGLGKRYYLGQLYRKGAFWENEHFIVRGGFGKTVDSAAS